MKRSYGFAAILAVGVAAWIASGEIGGTRDTGETPAVKPAVVREQPVETLPRVRVRTMTAEGRINEIRLFGRTEADRTVDVRMETAGRVVAREVEKGARVDKGDILVRIALDDRKARLAEAEALVEQRRMAYDAARQLSEKQFRSAVSLAQSKADLESAKAQFERIRLDIDRCTVRAPFAGIVNHLPAEIGRYAEVGDTVARIVDLDPIVVVGEIAERYAGRVKAGALAVVRLIDGTEVGGTVRFVSKVGTPATRTFQVEVEVDNPDGALTEGLTTELRLPLGSVRAHRVSPAVLTLSGEGVVGIKVVGNGDVVEFYPAKLIADSPDGMWLGGLPDRIRLITVGQEFVRAGQKVAPVAEAGGGTS